MTRRRCVLRPALREALLPLHFCRGTAGYLAGTLPDVVNMYALLVEHFRFPAGVLLSVVV